MINPGNLFVRTGVLPALQSIYVVVDSPDTAVAAAGPSIKYLQQSPCSYDLHAAGLARVLGLVCPSTS